MNAADRARDPDLDRQEIALLLDLGKRLVTELDLEAVLAQTAELACQVIQAETLVVPIIAPDRCSYRYRAAYGDQADAILGLSFPILEGACGWVLQHQRPLLFGADRDYELAANKRWQPGMASSLLVPLICRGNIIGGLSALGKRGGGAFGQRDLAVLTLFANQASIAIDNARLFHQLEQEKMLAEVTLASIGDAVITTTGDGAVAFLNGAATLLTGWPADEAVGRPVADVFHIVNEFSRERVLSPIDEVMAKGKKVNLANHTVLIARDGTEYNIEDSAAPIVADDGTLLGCVLVFHDVTEKHQAKKLLEWRAVHDVLTGLPNRILLADRFQRALSSAARHNSLLGVCIMDLDGFKPVNDTYGHRVGDTLLVQVAERLNECMRSMDTVARLGGDEFALLLCDIVDVDEMDQILRRLLASIGAPYAIDGTSISVSASIGVAVYPADDADPDTLLRHADQAMYTAKQSGRNRIHWFDVVHDKQTQASHQTLARVREALDEHELLLHYQPKVDLRTGETAGVEALLRWQHPERGMVPPLDFLPWVEQTDLIIDIGEWVIETALRQLTAWRAAGATWPVSVNIAAHHFQAADFVERIKAILARHPDVPPNCLDLEIVESAALGDLDQMRKKVRACQDLGVTFSLDDFGTGYSSLSHLKRLPAETLKIDQSFVHDLLDDPDDLAVVQALIGLATTFNRKLVAEGVELAEQAVLLLRLGCECAQGFGIARPMPAADIPAWLAGAGRERRWHPWTGAQWELADLPLLMAQHDHLQWIKRVIMSVEKIPLNMTPDELCSHHRCRFGQWYDNDGRSRYESLEAFSAIEPVHMEVHRLGQEIVRLQAAGDVAGARSLCGELLELKDQILSVLSALQRAVVGKGT